MPQEWIDALNVAVQAGKIPNIPPSTQLSSGAAPLYNGLNPTSPQVCSGSYGCQINGTIYNAPAGVMGLAFDDGPLPVRRPPSRSVLPSGVDPTLTMFHIAIRWPLQFPGREPN
jgi:hypothetical protein